MPLPLDLADYEQTASRMTAILKEYHRVKDNPRNCAIFIVRWIAILFLAPVSISLAIPRKSLLI